MPPRIQIASDFVCPYCYLLEALLRQVDQELEIEYLPYELTEPPQPREDTYNDPARRERYAAQLGPVCREIGLKMQLPPKVVPRPYTSLAFQGWHYAKRWGLDKAYHARVFQAYFEEERDIGDPEVLTALAAEIGLDPIPFREALERGEYAAAERKAARRTREELSVRVVPTVLCGAHRLEGFISSARELEEWLRSVR